MTTAAGAVTVLTGGGVTTVAARDGGTDELWVSKTELPGAVGWEIKPEGVCAGEVCIPLRDGRETELLAKRDGEELLNVAGFARHVGQPFAHSAEGKVWSFGAPRHEWERWGAGTGGAEMAPDFALPDKNGRVWSLADFRKRKVFLVTWASW